MSLCSRLRVGVCAGVMGLVCAAGAQAQSGAFPAKPGLWEVSSSSTTKMALPPDVQAKIDAMPAAQQDMMRQMMAGKMPGGSGAPVASTRQVCLAPGTNLDDMMNRAQQNSAMKCTFSNRSQSASGASFDVSCTSAQGNAAGHVAYVIADDSHASSTTHMTITATSSGHTMTSTIDASGTSKFLSADCGDVKPLSMTPPTH